MRNALALLLVALLGTRCVTSPAVKTDLGRSLDELLTRYESYGFSGTVLVAKDGQIVLHKGYGLADHERGIRNDTDTLYEIASLAKTFTAASILLLESRGALRTSDPVSLHLGEFPPAKATATLDHLATHTAGLVPEGSDLGDLQDREDFIANVKAVPLESVPGEAYRYTNAGFSLLAATVEKVSGVPFETFVRQNLFKAAGLRDIYFRGEAIPRRLARGYVGTPAELKESLPPPYRWSTRGSAGMIATVGELYRWHLALHEGRVLEEPALKKMYLERGTREGFAWHADRDEAGRRRIHKGGGNPEYATQIIYYPDERLVMIWASNNLRQRWRQALNRGIAATAFGTPFVVPPPPVKVTLDAYAGTYVTEAGKQLQLASKDGYLYALANDLGVPVDVMFFPTGSGELTGFNPTRLVLTRVSFDGETVEVGEVVARRVKS